MKNRYKVDPGTIVKGKWHQNQYTIVRELGYGANGIVYLALFQGQKVALKMSDNGMSVTSEVNVLKSFAKVQGSILGPSLIDTDDWIRRDCTISFYAMEYIEGPNLLTFIQQKGHSWAEVLILQLLSDLQTLHEKGWVFGDLKPENLIVTERPYRIRCIDVGGTTIIGRAIKEFTEFYDRGYWGLGSRKAEPGYDLFAVAMIFINTEYPSRFEKTTGGIAQLQMMIKQKPATHKFEGILLKALQGKYQTAREMRAEMLQIMSAYEKRENIHDPRKVNQHTQRTTRNSNKGRTQKKNSWAETFLIIMIISLLYILYIYGQVV
jgi:serine/threonine-protein kinase